MTKIQLGDRVAVDCDFMRHDLGLDPKESECEGIVKCFHPDKRYRSYLGIEMSFRHLYFTSLDGLLENNRGYWVHKDNIRVLDVYNDGLDNWE